jgi:hypothetical protein
MEHSLPIPVEPAQIQEQLQFLENVWVPWCKHQLEAAKSRVALLQVAACKCEESPLLLGQRGNGIQ